MGNNSSSIFFPEIQIISCFFFILRMSPLICTWFFPPFYPYLIISILYLSSPLLPVPSTSIQCIHLLLYDPLTILSKLSFFLHHPPSSTFHSFPFSSVSAPVWLQCVCRTVYPLSSMSSGMERRSGRGEFSITFGSMDWTSILSLNNSLISVTHVGFKRFLILSEQAFQKRFNTV